MKRRQKKRLINFLAGVLCILSLGMVIGTVYAGNLNRRNTEEEVIDEGKLLGEEAFRMAKETDARRRKRSGRKIFRMTGT